MAAASYRTPHATHSSNVNLHCAQCEAQIGIFENEWIRLTSSYARSKEKGTHFGTEVGQRTQVVPARPSQIAAEGCEMAEVFCRKCSNMVGQYCKKAPDREKQPLVDQYFYKLSRTFLKDGEGLRVDPIFGFVEDTTKATPGPRMSMAPRSSMTPSSRWMNTPLRESSSTPVLQGTARSTLRHSSVSRPARQETVELEIPATGLPLGSSPAAFDQVDQELATQNAMLREHSTKMSKHTAQAAEHEGRLRDHDARLEDQEKCVRAQASRIVAQDELINDQRRMIELQDAQLQGVSNQLAVLQSSMNELQSSITSLRASSAAHSFASPGQHDIIDGFEAMLRSMREAQSSSQEMEALRRKNEQLTHRLDSILSATGLAVDPDSSSAQLPVSASQAAQVLGKRKRHLTNDQLSSSIIEDSTTMNERQLIQSEQLRTHKSHILQHSSGDLAPTVQLPTMSEPYTESDHVAMYTTKSTAEHLGHIQDRPMQDVGQATLTTKSSDILQSGSSDRPQAHPPTVQTASKVVGVHSESIQALSPAPLQQPGLQNNSLSNTTTDSNSSKLAAAASTSETKTLQPTASSIAVVGSTPIVRQHGHSSTANDATTQETAFVEDTSMFDNVEFSDDDAEDLAFANDDVDDFHVSTGEQHAQQSSLAPQDSARRVTDTWIDRELRSTAPEPTKRRKTIGTARITLDRLRMGTPQSFAAAILTGKEPMSKPPPINRRQKDLHDELIRIGMGEWINKEKKSREYRDAVTAARARYRNAQKATALAGRGLNYNLTDPSARLPETRGPEAPSIAARKLVISQTNNSDAPPSSGIGAAAENDNTPRTDTPHETQPRGNETETEEAPMLTRARARRSSASLHDVVDNPERELRRMSEAKEQSEATQKPTAEPRRHSQRKSDAAAAAEPDTKKVQSTNNALLGGIDVSTSVTPLDPSIASNGIAASQSLPDAKAQPTRRPGRGRPKKSVTSTPTTTDKIGGVVTIAGSSPSLAGGIDSAGKTALPVTAAAPLEERNELLERMKLRAKQRDDAIAARDRLAEETMESEMGTAVAVNTTLS